MCVTYSVCVIFIVAVLTRVKLVHLYLVILALSAIIHRSDTSVGAIENLPRKGIVRALAAVFSRNVRARLELTYGFHGRRGGGRQFVHDVLEKRLLALVVKG